MKMIDSLRLIANQYDIFLCDLWGVIHDGDELYPDVLHTLESLEAVGKKVFFLSNAPRLASSVSERMDAMGVSRRWYSGALTSGEAAVKWLNNQGKAKFGGALYYLGLEKDAPLLEKLAQPVVSTLADAEWVLNGNFVELGDSMSDVQPLLHEARERNLPMLCINPDMEVVKLDGTRIACAGAIAEAYEELGGKVEYIGKPHSLIYQYALETLGVGDTSRVAMIGDNILTDIRGGARAGLDTVLVLQGILKEGGEQKIAALIEQTGVSPTYAISGFCW